MLWNRWKRDIAIELDHWAVVMQTGLSMRNRSGFPDGVYKSFQAITERQPACLLNRGELPVLATTRAGELPWRVFGAYFYKKFGCSEEELYWHIVHRRHSYPDALDRLDT